MRFAVLGPLEVSLDGGAGSLGGRKQRTLLAILLLHANEIVSRDQLIDALWGERPPPSAAASLDTYLYRLRKLVGHDRLRREGPGYLLRVERGELDVERFERQVANARRAAAAGEHGAVIGMLTEALGLWRGPAWLDLLDEPSAAGEARRLDELRLSASESRVEAELEIGGGRELVAELEQLVSEHPLRERLLGGLVLALYRAGRQADALDIFQTARGRLVEELGLEPEHELHELQRRILEHDPSLGAPSRFLPVAAPHRRRMLALAALLVLGVGVALALAGALSAGTAYRRPALPAGVSGVVAVRAGSGRVTTATPLSLAPVAACAGAGSVWVADATGGTVSRIDPASGVAIDRIPVGGEPASLTCGDSTIWVANSLGATVLRIDPTTETVTQTISLGGANSDALALGGGRLWVADSSARAVYELDPASGALQRTISLDVRPAAITFGAGALWVAGYDSATVLKLDPSSAHVVARVHVGTGPGSLAFAVGDLWVANTLDSSVSRIDPISLSVSATIPVDSGASALISDAGSIWTANPYSGSVSRIDTRHNAVVATVAVGGTPTSLTSAGGKVWVGVAASDSSHHGGTLVIATARTIPSADPAFYSASEPPQFDGLAYDTLITFEHAGGVDGLRLVPDLALTLPTPTDGGLAYAFRLRPGIRYSNGTRLHAGDFRRAIERLFRAESPGNSYYAAIVGATDCIRRRVGCDLSRGIVTNDAAGTVVFPLSRPDPEFRYKLTEQDYTAPILPGTPEHDAALDPLPGTGPYRIARADRTGVYFVRNPFFHEWSHAAQPYGNPDKIVWLYLPSQRDAATAVQRRRADWLFGSVPPPTYRQAAIQSPALLHSSPLFAVEFLSLNTHVAPFNNVLARKALNYAIDRNTIARLYGGPLFASPTCQPLVPGLPAYRRYCPYTSHPTASGAYTGPDLAYAKRLVAASGTRGEHISVLGSPDEGVIPPNVMTYVGSCDHWATGRPYAARHSGRSLRRCTGAFS